MIKLILIGVITTLFYSGCGGGSSPIIKDKDDVHVDAGGGNQSSYDDNQNGNQKSEDQNDDKKSEDQGDNKKSEDQSSNKKPDDETKTARTVHSFMIYTKSADDGESDGVAGINSFDLKIRRGSKTIFDSSIDSSDMSVAMNQDNTLLITSSDVLEVGDIISLNADGFTPQQQIISDVMIEGGSVRVSLKPIGSRQTFDLSALNSGRITTRVSMGASTKVNGEDVEFKTNDGSVVLNIKKSQIDRMAKRVRRSPKADKNTQIFLDITTIDPKTELKSAIGDFTYDSSNEPKSSRFTKSATPNETMLESVVMTSLSMTTSEGDEIHCFDGSDYDEESGECGGDSTATLKMKIPSSQFDKYADQYNKGERTIPLYHYSTSKSTWMRQVNNDKEPMNGELVLEDLNSNDIADEGDTLYISGEVGHFSYWNGDYPVELGYLNGRVELKNESKLPVGTVVVSKGADYIGRSFRALISDDLTYSNLGVKANAKVELYLQYPDGAKSESIFVDTSKSYEVAEVLICDYQMQEATVTIEDQDGNALEGAIVQSMGVSLSTDSAGHVDMPILKDKTTKVTASYNSGEFRTSSTKFITTDDATIVLDTRSFEFSGEISFKDVNDVALKFQDGFVDIYDDSYSLYQRTYVKDGSYSMLLPLNKLRDKQTIHVNAGIFVPLYAKFIEQDISIEINSGDISSKSRSKDIEFTLKPFIVSGKVTNPFASGDQKGIPNITIYSDSQSVQSDEDGNYRMLLFYREGGHILRAYDPISGDIVRPSEIIIAEDEQSSDEPHDGKDFIIDRRVATLEGVVLNDMGIPISGLPIYTSVGWLSTITDENGKFSFEISESWMMGRSDIVLHVYDANDNSKLLASKSVGEEISKGEVVDAGEILISSNIAPIIKSISWDEPVLDQPMNIYVDAYDPDNDDIKTTIFLVDGSKIDVVQGIAIITPQSVGNLEFRVLVEEVNGDNRLSAETISSMVVSANAKPIINSIDGFVKKFDKNSDMKINIDATDPDGGRLIFDAQLFDIRGDKSSRVSIIDNNITISKNIANGRYHLIISISDGIDQIERNFRFVANDNSSPENLTISKDGEEVKKMIYLKLNNGSFNLVANATDSDGDSLTYSWNFPETLGSASENELTITPLIGIFPITVSVTDGKEYISKEITLVIEDNLKPIINSIRLNPKTITRVGDNLFNNQGGIITSLSVEINATDPENQALSYKFGEIKSALATQSDFNSNKSKSYDISKFGVGRYAFKLDVKDADGKITSKRVLFKILENKPPRIRNFFVPIKAKLGTSVKLSAFATDFEGDDITYAWSSTGGTINSSTKRDTTLDIGTSAGSEIEVELEVKDSKGNTVKRKRTIKIVTNKAPIINRFRISPTALKIGKSIDFEARVSDPNFDEISYKWYLKGDLISQESRGTFEITDDKYIGDNEIKLVVSDGNLSAQQSATVSVKALAQIPKITLSTEKEQVLVGTKVKISAKVDVPSRVKWGVSDGGKLIKRVDSASFSADSKGLYTVVAVAINADDIKSEMAEVQIEVRDIDLTLLVENATQTIGNEFRIDAKLSDNSWSIPSNALWEIIEKPTGSSSSLSVDGSATITPDKIGAYTIRLSFTIDGKFFSETVVIRTTPDVKIDDEAHTVHGSVSDKSGEVLEGVKVHLYNVENISLYDETVTTDSDGSYLFSDLPSGRYYLVISGGDGYINQSEEIVIN